MVDSEVSHSKEPKPTKMNPQGTWVNNSTSKAGQGFGALSPLFWMIAE